MPSRSLPDGATLHWREAGSGDRVLLLLHAFPLHAGMWEPQLDPLAARGWRVISPDARGFGGSGPAPAALGMDLFARDAAALLDLLRVKKAVVGGLSMGGYAALELGRRRRDLVRALILADTRAAADSPEGRANREDFARNAIEKGIGWVAGELAPKLQGSAPSPAADARIRAIIGEGTPEAVAAAQRGMAARADFRHQLPEIDVPVLVLVGAGDRITPPPEAAAMRAALPDASLVELPGAGHLANIENPSAFNDAVGRWLDRL